MRNRTMLIFKPDCVAGSVTDATNLRHLLAEAGRLGTEMSAGWRLEMGAMVHLTENMAARLYEEHRGQPFYDGLVSFMTSSPSFVSVWSCEVSAWRLGREIVSQIRTKYGRDNMAETGPANLVHGSDSAESVEREVQWAVKCFILRCAEEG